VTAVSIARLITQKSRSIGKVAAVSLIVNDVYTYIIPAIVALPSYKHTPLSEEYTAEDHFINNE
jgi:hypothetical protein